MVDKIRIGGTKVDFHSKDNRLRLDTLKINDFNDVDWGTVSNQVKVIYLKNCTIQSFAGIENLTNLKSIEFSEYAGVNSIEKLDSLSNLSTLSKLTLSRIGISNLEGLENLPNLQQLNLHSNNFEKIPNIDIFPKLREFRISKNKISKIEGLENGLNLTNLDLGSNSISKIEGLESCVSLTRLSISENQLTKIEGLDTCINLEKLYLSNNNISVLEGLNRLKNLKILGLSRNKILKIENLDELENLELLSIFDNQISQIEGVKHLNKLEKIRLANNRISNINNLANVIPPNVKIIRLNENQIQDSSVLKNFPFKTEVNLNDNPVTNVPIPCLYCKAQITMSLDQEKECNGKLHSLIFQYTKNIPFLAKGKRYTVETGQYFDDRKARYVSTYAGKRDNILLKGSDRFSPSDVKRLKGPLCTNCMNLYLKEAEEILKKLTSSDKAARIKSSTKKVREKFNKNGLKWQKKIKNQ